MKQNFSRAEAAEYIGIGVHTLANWAVKNRGPKFSKLGNAKRSKVVYSKADLDLFLEAWKVDTIEIMRG